MFYLINDSFSMQKINKYHFVLKGKKLKYNIYHSTIYIWLCKLCITVKAFFLMNILAAFNYKCTCTHYFFELFNKVKQVCACRTYNEQTHRLLIHKIMHPGTSKMIISTYSVKHSVINNYSERGNRSLRDIKTKWGKCDKFRTRSRQLSCPICNSPYS